MASGEWLVASGEWLNSNGNITNQMVTDTASGLWRVVLDGDSEFRRARVFTSAESVLSK